MNLRGLIPATVTPFTEDGDVDLVTLEKHVARVARTDGVVGIAVNGHAGEITGLTREERREVVRVARGAVPDGKCLIAGIDGHSPQVLEAVATDAAEAGATGLLVLPPFDTRPLRHLAKDVDAVVGMFAHLDRTVGLPMVVFQYAESSGCAYSIEVLEALAEIRSVVGIKAGTNHITPYVEIYDRLHDKVAVLAANDGPPLLSMLLHGAAGMLVGISVVGTELWVELWRHASQGMAQQAVEIFQQRCLPLTRALFENQMPRTTMSPFAATKEALHQLGELPLAAPRPPAVAPNAEQVEAIRQALVQASLLP
jgi:4-hydroxy-tetrahydrodipicolinate synthase